MKMLKKLLYYAIPVILGAIILFSGYKLVTSLLSYKIANDEYDELREYVETVPDTSVVSEEISETDADETIHFAMLDVDHASLKNINNDYMGWLYVPALELSYPYVKGNDNEEYLHLTFEGTKSTSGAVFMDSYNYPNFRDFNTFIYAHNMKDKSMFGSLKLFGQDDSLAKNNPYIYVYTSNAAYQFEIFAYYVTQRDSSTYQIVIKPEDYDDYVKYISTVNQISLGEIDFSERPHILTLSTCQGSAGTNNRFVVHAVLVNKIDRE